MKPQTLAALHASIDKWEAIAAGTGVDKGTKNCPLCALFFNRDVPETCCQGCPVVERAGPPNCDNTPYREWADLVVNNNLYLFSSTLPINDMPPAFQDPARALAQAELDFLRSLLPEGARETNNQEGVKAP